MLPIEIALFAAKLSSNGKTLASNRQKENQRQKILVFLLQKYRLHPIFSLFNFKENKYAGNMPNAVTNFSKFIIFCRVLDAQL
jgi:hypothetical protein